MCAPVAVKYWELPCFERPKPVLYFQSLLPQDTEKDDFLEKDGCGRAGCSARFWYAMGNLRSIAM